MRIALILIFGFINLVSVFAQIQTLQIPQKELPKRIEFKGEFISCTKWNDSLGINYLLLSRSPIITPESAIEAKKQFDIISFNGIIDTVYSYEADIKERELYAYHYIQNSDAIKLLWKLKDFERDCPFDLTIEYLINPEITDLDNNGIAETWLLYWKGCRSDVSPLDMKLIMHQGKSKFKIHGVRKNVYCNEIEDDYCEKKEIDESFNSLPSIFIKHALELWNNNNMESWK